MQIGFFQKESPWPPEAKKIKFPGNFLAQALGIDTSAGGTGIACSSCVELIHFFFAQESNCLFFQC